VEKYFCSTFSKSGKSGVKFLIFFAPLFLKVDFVDQITLDYLLNKEMYKDHVQNKKIAQVNKEERKIYKKRIFQLFKETITGSEPEDVPMDVKYAYNNYVNASIQYFKIKDNHELIQAEFKDFVFTEENQEQVQDISFNEINQAENNLEADKVLIFSPINEGTKEQKAKSKSYAKKSKSELTNIMFKKSDSQDK